MEREAPVMVMHRHSSLLFQKIEVSVALREVRMGAVKELLGQMSSNV